MRQHLTSSNEMHCEFSTATHSTERKRVLSEYKIIHAIYLHKNQFSEWDIFYFNI